MEKGGSFSLYKKEMLQYISDLSVETSIFKTDNWMKDTPAETTQLLNSMGYVDETEVNQMIGYTSHFGKKFWDKKIAQFSSQQ